jgi:hypothetical protein
VRPLIRPPWHSEWDRHRPADAALQALGRYCASCERRLAQHAVAWHVARQEPIEEHLRADDWADTLPLCDNCAFAARRSSLPPEALLLPDRNLTFTIDEGSPLRYEREAVADDGLGRVLVVAADERAGATTAHFALNEQVPALARDFPLEPDADLLTRDWVDPRLELRGRAWDVAGAAVAQITAAPAEQRATVVGLVRGLAEDTGFWSTWATVLWRELGERELLEQILQPPGAADELLGGEATAPHPFPSTRPGWLSSPGAGNA